MIAFSSWASFKSAVWSFHFRAYSTYLTYLIRFRSNNILILPHVWDIAENEVFYLNLHCFIEITFELLLTHHYSNRFACSTFLDSDGQFFFCTWLIFMKTKNFTRDYVGYNAANCTCSDLFKQVKNVTLFTNYKLLSVMVMKSLPMSNCTDKTL